MAEQNEIDVLPDDGKELIFFGDLSEIPDCSEHGPLEADDLRLGIEEDVWVTQEETCFIYCPECIIDQANEVSDRNIVGTEQAVITVIFSIYGQGQGEMLENGMVNLGKGEVREDGVRLAENPSIDKIPDWLYDDGYVDFVEEDELKDYDELADQQYESLFDIE